MKQGTSWQSSRAPVSMPSVKFLRALLCNAKSAQNTIIKASTKVAKEANETGRSVYDIVLEKGLMTKEELDAALDPVNMLQSHKFAAKK